MISILSRPLDRPQLKAPVVPAAKDVDPPVIGVAGAAVPLSANPPSRALSEWAKTAPVQSLAELFRKAAAQNPSANYLGVPVGDRYQYQSYGETQKQINNFASSLIGLEINPGDRVAIIAHNRPEWPVADQGTLHVGGVVTPLYPSLAEHEIEYMLFDSGARAVVAETAEHVQKVLASADRLPQLKNIVAINADAVTPQARLAAGMAGKKLWSWQEFMQNGQAQLPQNQAVVENRVSGIKPTDIATIVYTSGTTGPPKGTMLAHGAILSNVLSVQKRISGNAQDVEFSFLPLAHLLERNVYYSMTACGASLAFCDSVANFPKFLPLARPTIVPNVPAGYEKVFDRVMARAPQSGLKRAIFNWAMKVGGQYVQARSYGHVGRWLGLKHELANLIAFNKIHRNVNEATGGRVRLFVSGGAPLRKDVGELFLASGFNMLEGYGLTETSPVLTLNPPERPRLGTVGLPIDGVEVKISKDGEVIARGPNIMNGYLNKPDATKATIDQDEWFHTGDLGAFDKDGYLTITGRIKDLLVMSNGKKVAPQAIEAMLDASRYIQQSVLVGDKRPAVGALLVPRYDTVKPWARAHGEADDERSLAHSTSVHALLSGEVKNLCASLSDYEKVKTIAVLEAPLSQDKDEITPTLKVKRNVVKDHYKALIDEMYAGGLAQAIEHHETRAAH